MHFKAGRKLGGAKYKGVSYIYICGGFQELGSLKRIYICDYRGQNINILF